jgi:hypothetical protein
MWESLIFWESHVFCKLDFLTLWLGACFKETKWFFLDFFLVCEEFHYWKTHVWFKEKKVCLPHWHAMWHCFSSCSLSAVPTATVFKLTLTEAHLSFNLHPSCCGWCLVPASVVWDYLLPCWDSSSISRVLVKASIHFSHAKHMLQMALQWMFSCILSFGTNLVLELGILEYILYVCEISI